MRADKYSSAMSAIAPDHPTDKSVLLLESEGVGLSDPVARWKCALTEWSARRGMGMRKRGVQDRPAAAFCGVLRLSRLTSLSDSGRWSTS